MIIYFTTSYNNHIEFYLYRPGLKHDTGHHRRRAFQRSNWEAQGL
jgi:hypothetical protein